MIFTIAVAAFRPVGDPPSAAAQALESLEPLQEQDDPSLPITTVVPPVRQRQGESDALNQACRDDFASKSNAILANEDGVV
jgi:hypothetical protein